MTDYQSIYTNHYEGETYRFGVAYLREEPADHVADLVSEDSPGPLCSIFCQQQHNDTSA